MAWFKNWLDKKNNQKVKQEKKPLMTTVSLSKLSYFFLQNKQWTWHKIKSHLYKGPRSTYPFNNAKHKTWTDIQKIASF